MANGDNPIDTFALTEALRSLTVAVGMLRDDMKGNSGVSKGLEDAAGSKKTKSEQVTDIFEDAVGGIGKELESVGNVWVTTLENAFSPFAQISQGLTQTMAIMSRSIDGETAAIEGVVEDLADSLKKLGVDFDKYQATEQGRARIDNVKNKERERFRRQSDRDFLERFGGLVTVPIAAFTNYLMGLFTKSTEMMQGSLKFNKTFSEAVEGAGDKLAAVPGDLTDKMTALFAFEERGLSQVGSASFALAGRMQKTGQSVSNLIGIQQKLMMVGGLSLKQNENLAKVLRSTSISNQVSTDSLLEGLAGLQKSLATLALAGATDAVSTAVTKLAGQFPGMSKSIGEFTDSLATVDISQAGILGIQNDLEALTSGRITDAETLRQAISRVAQGARRFAGDMKGMSIVTRRNIEKIIGQIGVAGMVLDDKLNDFVAKQQTSQDKILNAFKTAWQDILAPFEESITGMITTLGRFGESLNKINNSLSDATGGFISISNLLGGLLLQAGVTRIGKAAGVKTAFGAGGFFSKIFSVKGLTGVFKRFLGPIGLGMLAFEGLSFLLGESSKETAENTAELVSFEKDKARIDLGRSRFERLTAKLLNDQMLSSRFSEAMLTKGIPELIDAVNGVTGAVIGSALPDEVPVPVRIR
tara:strand:+ start:25339 stop:27267 length:1929 start_codon:yes stop_codon:yes gene_type:complete